MRVLWFEVSEPVAYVSEKTPIGGWQDSLERIVKTAAEIELIVSFMSEKHSDVKVIDGVTYIPILSNWSSVERKFRSYWDVFVEKMLPIAKRIIEDYKPDLIQVFGTEWPFGQIAAYTDIPVVIHIMGAIIPYNNANFPPGYSCHELYWHHWWQPKKIYDIWKEEHNRNNREKWELRTWKLVKYYMGRTLWDEALSRVMHPGRSYYHVEEALRYQFISRTKRWKGVTGDKLQLLSTGCSSFWKGPDMMLKVARILCELDVNFEWKVAGRMDEDLKKMVEHHEGIRFEDCNINILGFRQPEELVEILCSSTIYVHTAYIENSPNSICEAQCLGVPVVSTNVGGISTLINDGRDGILVPSNDPWSMADAIIQLMNDKERMQRMSECSFAFAQERHSDRNIKNQLINVYHTIINEHSMRGV